MESVLENDLAYPLGPACVAKNLNQTYSELHGEDGKLISRGIAVVSMKFISGEYHNFSHC